jgi:hypothetical protein
MQIFEALANTVCISPVIIPVSISAGRGCQQEYSGCGASLFTHSIPPVVYRSIIAYPVRLPVSEDFEDNTG